MTRRDIAITAGWSFSWCSWRNQRNGRSSQTLWKVSFDWLSIKAATFSLETRHRLLWEELFQPVIQLCQDGFTINKHTGKSLPSFSFTWLKSHPPPPPSLPLFLPFSREFHRAWMGPHVPKLQKNLLPCQWHTTEGKPMIVGTWMWSHDWECMSHDFHF